MKKKIIILIGVLIILIPSCILTYKIFTKPKTNEETKVTEDLKGTFINKNLKIDGSTATQPLLEAYSKYFMNDAYYKTMKEEFTKTHQSYVKLINKETDLIIVTSPSEEELQLAKDNGVELEVTKVVNEGFVFFINAKNPVENLSLEQIVDIYSGKINNWNEVGGESTKIIPYQRPNNSGSQTGMLSLVMKGSPLRTPTTEEMMESMGDIIDIVADYDNDRNGLGYSYYYYANIMYKTPGVKFLGIDGVKPTYETIQNETYPIMTAYYIVTRKDANQSTKDLKKAMLSKEGQRVAKEAGYVPTKES